MGFKGYTIVDGDGHVIEDTRGHGWVHASSPTAISSIPIHSSIRFRRWITSIRPTCTISNRELSTKSVRRVGWISSRMSGIETTVLYTTLGLAFGKIVSRDWAIDVARGYNDWLYHEYMKKEPAL